MIDGFVTDQGDYFERLLLWLALNDSEHFVQHACLTVGVQDEDIRRQLFPQRSNSKRICGELDRDRSAPKCLHQNLICLVATHNKYARSLMADRIADAMLGHERKEIIERHLVLLHEAEKVLDRNAPIARAWNPETFQGPFVDPVAYGSWGNVADFGNCPGRQMLAVRGGALMNPLMIFIKIIKLR